METFTSTTNPDTPNELGYRTKRLLEILATAVRRETTAKTPQSGQKTEKGS